LAMLGGEDAMQQAGHEGTHGGKRARTRYYASSVG
jgi:hypothetical protein